MEVSTPTPAHAGRIAFLDYLRIFAFLSVLAGHQFQNQMMALAVDSSVHATARYLLTQLLVLSFGGGAGVVVFFLVSGYIIAHVLQTERSAEFAVKRFFRIYPLYIAAVLVQSATGSYPHAPRSVGGWVAQLLLLGDFFKLPYALGGVEWTLRVEVVFYAYMALLRSAGLMHQYQRLLPYALFGTVLGLNLIAPFPGHGFKGYLTIYGPFLLLGVAFYLREAGQVGLTYLLAFTLLIFHQYFTLIGRYQSYWLGAHFAGVAFLIFAACWGFRRHIVATPLVLFVSELTYAVYLFHNWAYAYIVKKLSDAGVAILRPEIQGLIGLFVLCLLANRYVEKPFVRLGRVVLRRIRNRYPQNSAAASNPPDAPPAQQPLPKLAFPFGVATRLTRLFWK